MRRAIGRNSLRRIGRSVPAALFWRVAAQNWAIPGSSGQPAREPSGKLVLDTDAAVLSGPPHFRRTRMLRRWLLGLCGVALGIGLLTGPARAQEPRYRDSSITRTTTIPTAIGPPIALHGRSRPARPTSGRPPTWRIRRSRNTTGITCCLNRTAITTASTSGWISSKNATSPKRVRGKHFPPHALRAGAFFQITFTPPEPSPAPAAQLLHPMDATTPASFAARCSSTATFSSVPGSRRGRRRRCARPGRRSCRRPDGQIYSWTGTSPAPRRVVTRPA